MYKTLLILFLLSISFAKINAAIPIVANSSVNNVQVAIEKKSVLSSFLENKLSKPLQEGVIPIDNFAIAGFVLGFLSLFIAGFGLGILGLVFSIIGLKRIKQAKGIRGGKGLAIAGIILSIFGFAIWTTWIVLYFLVL